MLVAALVSIAIVSRYRSGAPSGPPSRRNPNLHLTFTQPTLILTLALTLALALA